MDTSYPPKAGAEALPELTAFLAPLAPLLHYAPSRQSLERYLTGLLSDLPHKNCETIAATVAGTSSERLQHLLTDAAWEAERLNEARVRWLSAHSPPHGVLVLDDTGLPKQGKASVGVARQYTGTLGKVANCQIVVSAEWVADAPQTSQPLHWPVTAQLYLPANWLEDVARRASARIPARERFAPKTERALALVDQAQAWDAPFQVVVADAGYGDNPPFLQGLEERGLAYVCGVEAGFGMRLPVAVRAAEQEAAAWAADWATTPGKPPRLVLPPGQPRKHRRTSRGRPKAPRPAPLLTAEALVAAQPEAAWQTVTWREGTKQDLSKQFVALRVQRATGGATLPITNPNVSTGPEGWLLAERPVPGTSGERKFYLANLPVDTPLPRLVELAHARWAVEQFYEDAKGECGLADYQGRRWDGLQRHLALVLLAYSFLAVQALRSEQASSPPAAAFPPGAPVQSPRRPSAGAVLARRGPDPLVHPDQPTTVLSSP